MQQCQPSKPRRQAQLFEDGQGADVIFSVGFRFLLVQVMQGRLVFVEVEKFSNPSSFPADEIPPRPSEIGSFTSEQKETLLEGWERGHPRSPLHSLRAESGAQGTAALREKLPFSRAVFTI